MAGAAPAEKNYQWNVFDDKAALGSALGEAVAKVANDAVKSRGRFHVAVSGGSLPSVWKKVSAPTANVILIDVLVFLAHLF